MSTATRTRLDTELVRRGLARSRTHAGRLIAAGRVRVDGRSVHRPATLLSSDQDVQVADGGDLEDFASRGGHKLAGALDTFEPEGLVVQGRRCLDAGASTGGFTDVLLRRGAAHVVAVDVGSGQLDPRLAADRRVEVRDRTNVRHLGAGDVPEVRLVVADLSFISLRLVLPALRAVTAAGGDLLLMVKPQFEVGRDKVGASGVVRSPGLRATAVRSVVEAGLDLGLRLHGITASVLPGPSGNHEYFVWFSVSGHTGPDPRPVLGRADLADRVAAVVGERGRR